jgi:hypothetical protein
MPSNPNSLHYLDDNSNQYMQALKALGLILENYDTDKKYPIYGFGGKLPQQHSVCHCFALNGDIYDPEVQGIEGCINAYKSSIQKCGLFGPTHFSSVLKQTNDYCASKKYEESQYNQRYNILIILTDGEILDVNQTHHELVESSEYPLSVIIIGIGEAEFGVMETLDADKEPLYSEKSEKE